MRAVLQRVTEASCEWDGGRSAIGPGYAILLGAAETDKEADADRLAQKILKLRIFSDADGKFNLDAQQVHAQVLVVPQFTLFAESRGQNRPSFLRAARPEHGRPLIERFIERLRADGADVQGGAFGKHMQVRLVNDGPVTLVMSTEAWDTRIV